MLLLIKDDVTNGRYHGMISLVHLVVLQLDLVAKRKFSPEEIEKFAQEHNFIHFMETSVKNNINVNESMQ